MILLCLDSMIDLKMYIQDICFYFIHYKQMKQPLLQKKRWKKIKAYISSRHYQSIISQFYQQIITRFIIVINWTKILEEMMERRQCYIIDMRYLSRRQSSKIDPPKTFEIFSNFLSFFFFIIIVVDRKKSIIKRKSILNG